jgi:LysM repeat protein
MRMVARAVWGRRQLSRGLLGVVLVLAALSAATRSASAGDGYVVEYGDTLSEIAGAYGMTVEELTWLNGLTDPNTIYVGQYLTLWPSVESGGTHDGEWSANDDAGSPDTWQPKEPTDEFPPYVDPWTVRDYLFQAAWLYGWDPNLILALAWQESGWQQAEVSWVGAIGVMQLMPTTAASLEEWYFARDLDVWSSAWDNVEAGVAYLTMLYDKTGSVELALAGYYQGIGSVYADGLFPETEDYVANIRFMQGLFAEGILP